jgi:HSP20 family molecular chaperone IbpA
VEADEAKAKYRDGILVVTLPLARNELRSRSVPIEVPDAEEHG